MTKEEWAVLLDSLRADDGARRDALLMLSDEDWVDDADRPWIRNAAVREDVLRPTIDGNAAWTFDSYAWTFPDNANALIPRRVGDRLAAKERAIKDCTEAYKSAKAAWLDLLEAIS